MSLLFSRFSIGEKIFLILFIAVVLSFWLDCNSRSVNGLGVISEKVTTIGHHAMGGGEFRTFELRVSVKGKAGGLYVSEDTYNSFQKSEEVVVSYATGGKLCQFLRSCDASFDNVVINSVKKSESQR